MSRGNPYPNLPWKDGKAPVAPGARPKCHWCEKTLKTQVFWDDFEKVTTPTGWHRAPTTQRLGGYGYRGAGFFCSLRHGYLWAIAVLKENERAQAKKVGG